MARPRIATAILDARGSFKNHPEKKRPLEPPGKGAFPENPPEHLNEKQVASWCEIVSITPAGVLTGSDTLTVETLAILLTQFRELGCKMNPALLARMTMLQDKLGLSPSGRAKLVVPKSLDNGFDGF